MHFPALDSASDRVRIALFLLLATCACVAFGNGAVLPVTEVAPGVFVHQGQHADVDDPGRGDSANIGFIAGDACVAVIDTGGSIATGTALRAAIRTETTAPICYVINTHIHFDHVLGNAAFVDDRPVFIGHENLLASMEASRDFFVEHFGAELGGDPDRTRVITPARLVEGQVEIDLGNRAIRLIAERTAHTDNDLTVLDLKTNTLWTGDLVFLERLPVLEGSLKGWLRWLDGAVAADYRRIVPGHGPASAPWPAAVAPLRDYLERLLVGTREAVANGELLEDAMRRVARDATENWVLTERAHPRNVSRAYRELEWE